MIALVPGRLALNREDRLQQFAPPLPVTGFDMAMVWHDRTTTHPMHRWLRDRLITLVKQNQ
jgi:DNA-binding transcriptional LysR family regulator